VVEVIMVVEVIAEGEAVTAKVVRHRGHGHHHQHAHGGDYRKKHLYTSQNKNLLH
jgi:hypothetical protein